MDRTDERELRGVGMVFQVIHNTSIAEIWKNEAGLSSMEVERYSKQRDDIFVLDILPNP